MKKLLLGGMFLLFALTGTAQMAFMHTGGGSFNFSSRDSINSRGLMATYAPRVQYEFNENSAIGLAFKPALSPISWVSSIVFGDGTRVIDLPVLLQFNSGLGATKNTEKRAGFFVGAGFDGALIQRLESRNTTGGWIYGPTGELGVAMHFTGIPIIIRMKYMQDISGNDGYLLGIGLMYTFGMK